MIAVWQDEGRSPCICLWAFIWLRCLTDSSSFQALASCNTSWHSWKCDVAKNFVKIMAVWRRERPKTISLTSREVPGVCPACPMAGQPRSTTSTHTVARQLAVWAGPKLHICSSPSVIWRCRASHTAHGRLWALPECGLCYGVTLRCITAAKVAGRCIWGAWGDFFCLHLHGYFGVHFLFPDFLFSENFSSIPLSLKQGLNCERQVEKHIYLFF